MTALIAGDVLARVRELPPLPALVIELIELLDNEGLSVDQLGKKISSDQALAAKVLRLANSSFYGMSREVTSIENAAAILGLRTMRNVATAAVLTGHFEGGARAAFEFKAFWRHSIGTALCSSAIARELRLEEGMAFTLGLLHDIGRLVLATTFAQAFDEALDYQRGHDCPALEAERAVLGIDHAAIGGLIAERWHFSPTLVAAIAGHHEPPAATDGAPSFCDLVHVADNIAHALDLSKLEDDVVPPLSMPSWSRVGLSDAAYMQVFQLAQGQHESLCAALLD